MFLFAAVLAGTLLLCEDPVVPESAVLPGGRATAPKVLNRGRGDFAATVPATKAGRSAEPSKGPWTLSGTVKREGETLPLAAALGLELIPLGIGPHATAGLQSMITTPNGGYSWVGLFPGAYRLRALPARDSSSHLAVAVEVELPDGSADSHELHRDILLPTPRLLQGLLRTKANHPPVGIRISVSEIGLHRGTAVCDADGTFEIAQVGVGPFEFQVRANDGTPVPVETVERAHSESGTVQVAVVIP